MFLGEKGTVIKKGKTGDFNVTRYKLYSERIPRELDNFKIVQLSDLHNAKFGEENCRLAEEINALKPDLLAITGDMFAICHPDFSGFFGLLSNLGGFPKLMVLGNHELRLEEDVLFDFCNMAENCGVTILRNETEQIERGGKSIDVIGLELPMEYYRRSYQINDEKKTLTGNDIADFVGKNAENTFSENAFSLVLSHNPLYFDAYAEYGADLYLSGHVHGGIIEIPKVGGLLSPERKFFPRYSSGIYRKNNSSMIVSRGMCSGQPLVRVNNPRELIEIVLKSK